MLPVEKTELIASWLVEGDFAGSDPCWPVIGLPPAALR